MAIPMIEVMREKLLALAETANNTKTDFYKDGDNIEKLRAMDSAEIALDSALATLKPEELIELIRKD